MTDFGSSKRRKGTGTPKVAFLVAGAMLLVIGGGGWTFLKVNEHNAEQQIIAQRESVRAFTQVLDDDATRVIDTKPKSDGGAGVLEGAVRTLCRQIVEDDRAMDKEIEALNFNKDTLDSTSEADLGTIDSVADQTAKARKVVEKYRVLRRSRIAAFRAAVDKAPMSLSDKETTLKRFNRALDASFYDSERLWRVRDEVLRSTGDLVAILQAERGNIRATPYGRSFVSPAAYSRFSSARWKLNQAQWELNELNNKGMSNARRQLEAASRNLEP